MNIAKRNIVFHALFAGALLTAQDAAETKQVKITRALSAAPAEVAKSAKIVDTDTQRKMVVLHEGNNGLTCMRGNPKVISDPSMCADAASMQ